MRCTERCPLCPSRTAPVGSPVKPVVSGDWNYGPHNVLLVGEAPGRQENNMQRIFVGKTGEELNSTYLPMAGLSRREVSMTNTVKCHWADSSDAPPPELVKSCSEFHLRRELAQHNPEFLILMGATACSLLNIDVELEHGIPRNGTLLGWSGKVFPTFHPALGLHNTGKMLAMVDSLDGDFPRLRQYLRGNLQPLKSPEKSLDTRLTRTKDVALTMRHGLDQGLDIAVDTESMKRWRGYPSTVKWTPWCATFAMWPGESFMVRVVDEDAFKEFGRHLRKFRRVIFHNAPYDHEVLRVSGVDVDVERIHDTMQMAYDDGRLRIGLKSLGFRLIGRRMRSFDEIVVPHSRDRALSYIEEAMGIEWPKPVQEPTGVMKTKNCPECKGKGVVSLGRGRLKKTYPCDCEGGKVTVEGMTRKQSMNDKLWRLAIDMQKDPEGIDIWERWGGWGTEVQPLIDRIGPIPIPSIEYVPEAEAIEYACGDAETTLRIFPILKERLVHIRRSVQL